MTHPYASQQYAEAFSPNYKPIGLSQSQTWILQRAIDNTDYVDAIGCYPRCVLAANVDLSKDFIMLQNQQIVSLTLINDIFFHPDLNYLQTNFDVCKPFKTHYLHDYQQSFTLTKHHRYEVKRAHQDCHVKIITLSDYIDHWQQLYQELIKRHEIRGIQTFSPQYFHAVSQFPQLITTAAFDQQDNIIAMHLWFEYEGYVYSHLAAANAQGYRLRAAYAIYDFVIKHFANKKCIDFGSGAGLSDDPNDGLARFKRGFANTTKTNYLCGKILMPDRYEQLSKHQDQQISTNYFPAYRT